MHTIYCADSMLSRVFYKRKEGESEEGRKLKYLCIVPACGRGSLSWLQLRGERWLFFFCGASSMMPDNGTRETQTTDVVANGRGGQNIAAAATDGQTATGVSGVGGVGRGGGGSGCSSCSAEQNSKGASLCHRIGLDVDAGAAVPQGDGERED